MVFGLGKIIENAVKEATSSINRLANKKEMEAVCAAAALLAMADGSLDPVEKTKAMESLQKHPDLSSFSGSELSAKFEDYVAQMQIDLELGTIQLLDKIQPFKEDRDSFLRILGIAKAVASADGSIGQAEQRMLDRIKKIL